MQECRYGLQDTFRHFLQRLRCYTALELENGCPLSKFFIRERIQVERDQGNKIVTEIPNCNALSGNNKSTGKDRSLSRCTIFTESSRLGHSHKRKFWMPRATRVRCKYLNWMKPVDHLSFPWGNDIIHLCLENTR
ncbi:hypothetical protein AVEN_44767-1 [Araneus ventricosus]|uniref:Uncharacterized protein n=1 Tax=Araneus ventricosus TaxID=182803 RepID=A0A4Y2LN14_ARAVE|nr:hypothetical protein AVEN_44767-1 [Araneus ventricosus]